jgi:hypothetical protein
LETKVQFTIRGSGVGRVRFTGAGETRYSGVCIAGMEALVSGEIGTARGPGDGRFAAVLEGSVFGKWRSGDVVVLV